MEKTNYSVARVVTYTKQSIGKAERHNERKNKVYSNMNVDLEQKISIQTILKNTADTILQKSFMKKPSILQKKNMVKIILYLLLCTQMNKILH